MLTLRIIDSHTGGEPTRVVVDGGPDLGSGTVAEQCAVFRDQYDRFRAAVVNEPRGSDVVVGALLCPPSDPTCAFGVIFFNNVGVLGMCGHGTIGVMVTLARLGRIQPGTYRLETPVGIVTATLHDRSRVTVENVPSRRSQCDVTVDVPGIGWIKGDVAWAGNWFYLVKTPPPFPLTLGSVDQLVEYTWRIRQTINAKACPEVDHVELFGPAHNPGAQSRNFVLCPGKAYDRSPCGTGTSAKLACLAADGLLQPGQPWVQESVIGSTFTGSYAWLDEATGRIVPSITGTAFVNAEATLLIDPDDPFAWGLHVAAD